jgi:hypothetical protein
MDAVKLKNSCICGNTLPYAECCGRYSKPGIVPETDGRSAFRHDLHDLYMYLFPLRNLYQAYWERLSQEEYPHHLLMADPDYGRVVMANFFWDYSVQFSDARPVLRAARDVEPKNIRLANDFREWSLAPLWLYKVLESDGHRAHLTMLDTGRSVRVEHGGELPAPGEIFAGRILTHRGREQVHPAVLTFPAGSEESLRDRLRVVCRGLGVKSGAGLRPDVQCDEWRRHGAQVLALWRELVYDARVGVPARTMAASRSFRLPAAARGDLARQLRADGAVALDATRLELRYRALTLARLEAETDGWLRVTLLDEAYRPYVFHWLGDHLDAPARMPGTVSSATPSAPESGAWIEWSRQPHDALGGETPVEASRHDFGKRRLDALLMQVEWKGEEITALRRYLGLSGLAGFPGMPG